MATARDSRNDNQLDLIADYGEVLARYGPDSGPAERFVREHPGKEALFQDLTDAARRLRDSAREHEQELHAQHRYLTEQIRGRRRAWIAVVVFFGFLIIAALFYRSEREKNLLSDKLYKSEHAKNIKFATLLNLAISPFVHYKIPMSQRDTTKIDSLYQEIDLLAERLPPARNKSIWSKELLYAWARSALTGWNKATAAEKGVWLSAFNTRTRHIRETYPDYSWIYSLEAQMELKQGDVAYEEKRSQDAVPHLQKSVALNDRAIRLEESLTVAWHNMGYAQLLLGRLATDNERRQYLEAASRSSETAVTQGKVAFLLGKEPVYATYLDTLGEIYEELVASYRENGQIDQEKTVIRKAIPIDTEIATNYNNVHFEDLDKEVGEAIRKLYQDEARKNLDRLQELRKRAKELGITDLGSLAPENAPAGSKK